MRGVKKECTSENFYATVIHKTLAPDNKNLVYTSIQFVCLLINGNLRRYFR